MKAFSYEWTSSNCLEEEGVIVGLSKNHEWMLKWWFKTFRQNNSYPVTFIDFGDMSPEAKKWCHEHGRLISLNLDTNLFLLDKSNIDSETVKLWESSAKGVDIWKARQEFFKKPFACLASPYRRTIWIDADCQVVKSIKPIFEFPTSPHGLALVAEPPAVLLLHKQNKMLEPGETEYNTGVVLFDRDSPIIPIWAKYCVESSKDLRGDQEALSRFAYENDLTFSIFPSMYNWRVNITPSEEEQKEIVILHLLGPYKDIIRSQIQMENI